MTRESAAPEEPRVGVRERSDHKKPHVKAGTVMTYLEVSWNTGTTRGVLLGATGATAVENDEWCS